MPTLAKTIFELQRIFRLLNEHYYNGELTAPIIAVQSQGKRSVYGWCTLRKVWREDVPEVSEDGEQDTPSGRNYYEITITAEYLNRSNTDIAETMLHEMAHLYNLQHGIKDNSRSGTYHNEKFKATAEAHGLTVKEKDEKYGWAFTGLTEQSLAHIRTLSINRQAFKVARLASKPKGSKAKTSSRKYVCPCCDTTVRATKEVNIMCADCMELMQVES